MCARILGVDESGHEIEDWEGARERSRARHEADRRRRERRQRRGLIVAGGMGALFVVAVLVVVLAAWRGGGGDASAGTDAGRTTTAERETTAKAKKPAPELPGGGRTIFPGKRVVAFYGTAGTPVLGTLGRGTPAQAARRLKRQAGAYHRPGGRQVLPAFELIATVASSAPGDGALYRDRKPLAEVERSPRAIRGEGGLFIIDVQPGRARFIDEVRRYRSLLEEPDVSLALDPEWKMEAGTVPGRTIGHTTAAEVNEVTRWLAALTERKGLPQKLLVIHQFTPDMIRGRGKLLTPKGLAVTIHVDGFGGRAVKRRKYRQLVPRARYHAGFKLFYREDIGILAPRDVLGLRPPPLLITYQ